MLNATYIFILKLNNRTPGDGMYALSGLEMAFFAILFAIYRNT